MSTKFSEGKGFYLRELREEDLSGNWYSWFNDSEVTKFQNKKIFPNSREKQRDYYNYLLKSKEDVVFAIVENETEQHIGNVGLHHIDWVHRSAELGIVIGESKFWGKGYGKGAWYQITKYGFLTLNLRRIFAIVMADNLPSAKCAELVGFKKQGIISEVFFKNAKYHDIFYFNLLKKDFQEV